MIQHTTHEMLAEPVARRLAEKYPNWTGALGVACIALGIIAVVAASLVTMATVFTFGVLILLGGVLQCIHAIGARGQRDYLPGLVAGVAFSILGLLLVINPFAAATAITLVLALFFVVGGVLHLSWAARWSGSVRRWLTLSGAIALLLGLLVLIAWPDSGLWLIGLFVGIELILTGTALLAINSARCKLHAE